MVGTVVVLELVDVSAVVDEGRTVVVVATVEVVGPDVDAKIVDCLGVPDGRAIVVVGADWRGGGGRVTVVGGSGGAVVVVDLRTGLSFLTTYGNFFENSNACAFPSKMKGV